MVIPHWLLDPNGFQDVTWDVRADLVDALVNVLMDSGYIATISVVDTIALECSLCCQAHPATWYNPELQAMKRNRRT